MRRALVAMGTVAVHVAAATLLGSGGTGGGAAGPAPRHPPLQVRLLAPEPVAQADDPATATLPAPAFGPALPIPHVTAGDGEPAASDPQFARFLPDAALDRGAVPRSQPDVDTMQGVRMSGLPIRMRLFIDETGRVVRVDTLRAGDDDADAVERLKTMLSDTAFVPGQLGGRDVPSYQDLEFRLDEV